MRFRLTALAAAGVLIGTSAAPAFAKPDDLTPEAMARHLAEVGSWRFAARATGPDGKSVCTEVWRFDADGTGTVESGEERVTTRWRTALGDQTDRWLYTTSLSTNGKPDCTGESSDPASFPRKESGFVVMFFNSGGAMTCRPARYIQNADGTPGNERMLMDEDCWGTLNPMPKG